MTGTPWTIEEGEGPLIAAAIHDGHEVRREVLELLAVDEEERLREEDPSTGRWTAVAPTRIIVHRSRFEVDMSRPREKAVYLKPEDAWGLNVWKQPPPAELVQRSLELHDRFYSELGALLDRVRARSGRFVLLDLHSYNHRRGGAASPAAPQEENPDIDLATFPGHRVFWAPVIDAFLEAIGGMEVAGRCLDVRENAKFFFGNLGEWVHANYPHSGCVLSLDVKKFFMDEWTGELHTEVFDQIRRALAAAVPAVEAALARMPS